METILVTGSEGFIGKNLVERLKRQEGLQVLTFDVGTNEARLRESLAGAGVIYHLAGVNRPADPSDHEKVNAGLTAALVGHLREMGRKPLIILSSSTQAALDNHYGRSKQKAEETLAEYAAQTGAPVRIFRLPGVFGKWCRPNYNSVVATFCYNVAHGLPITVSDAEKELPLVYIDDVVSAFAGALTEEPRRSGCEVRTVTPEYCVKLGVLVEKIMAFKAIRESLRLPDEADRFTRVLHATYVSYLPEDQLAYSLTQRKDHRGALAELLKSEHFGQIFISRTRPGITRGNHYHDTKVEKFCVVEGEAIIRFRHILGEGAVGGGKGGEVLEYTVSGREFNVVDIPPGYTHSIENIGQSDLVTLFWSIEAFDPLRPDTYAREVL